MAAIFKLERLADEPLSTSGQLDDGNGTLLCHILERGTANPDHPRIPAGVYPLRFHGPSRFDADYTSRFGKIGFHAGRMIEIAEVPGRTAVLFHCGNTQNDTLGCVILGESVVRGADGHYAVPGGQSGPAFSRIYPLLANAVEAGGASVLVADPKPEPLIA